MRGKARWFQRRCTRPAQPLRQGRVDDGSAVTDYDEEEIARKMSITTGVAYAEWGKTKINMLDTPGFNMFVHEVKTVLPVVESALVVVDGVAGVEVVTERVWGYCDEVKLPRMIVVSRMDRERADANRVLESLTQAFGRTVTPLQLPIGREKNLTGVVDLVRMKARTYQLGGDGKGKEGEIPADLKDAAQEAHEKLVGSVEGEVTSGNGEPPKRKVADSEPVSLYVFKTVSDPFAGRISYFKVFSGVVKNDASLQNFTRNSQEKLAHISIMQGKTAVPVTELHAGDIGSVAKLRETLTGDTLGDKAAPIQYPKVHLPEPAITFAIEPKSRADAEGLMCRGGIRNKPEGTASTATAKSKWSRCHAGESSSSSTISLVERFRGILFLPWKKELRTLPPADTSPDFRWSISRSFFMTARITMSIQTTSPSKWRDASPSRKPWNRPSPLCWNQ